MYLVTLINNDKETTIHSPFFSGNKLLNAEIKREINIADGFHFEILPNNPGYNSISPLKTLIKVMNSKTGNVEFDGRILMPTESMSDSGSFSKSFICESELGFLHDSTQRHGEYHDITVRDFLIEIINNHNADIADDEIDKKFEVGIVEVDSSTGTLYRYLGYESTFETIKDKLLDRLGGELRVRKEKGVRYLDYLQSVGARKNTEIRLAKNLKSITKETDPSDIITRLIPLGERIASEDEEATDASEARLTIESVNNGKDYIDDKEAMAVFGVITKSHTWNDITQPNRLLTSGRQFLNENNRVKIQHQLSALDLSVIGEEPDSFEIGNWHPVINEVMGINEDMRIVRQTIDIINPESNTLTIGDKFLRASDYQKEARKAQARLYELEGQVESSNQKVIQLRSTYNQINEQVEQVQTDLLTIDVKNLPIELQGIHSQISDLQMALQGRSNPLRVATFNIWQSRIDIEAYKNFALSNRLDIIGLQEVLETTPEQLKTYGLNNIRYANVLYEYGNAIQSRFNLSELEIFELPARQNVRQILIKSAIEFEGKTISVYNTHLDSRVDDSIRLQQLEFIKQTMDADPTEYKILTGDFNVQDKAHYDLLGDLKSAQGHDGVWHDTWDVNIEPWNNGAIDNILVTPNIDILKVEMPLDKLGSDHYMLWAEIVLR